MTNKDYIQSLSPEERDKLLDEDPNCVSGTECPRHVAWDSSEGECEECFNDWLESERKEPEHVFSISAKKLYEFIYNYFDVGNSYAYNLTRDKAAFNAGTMSFDDFEEFDEQTVDDLTNYIVKRIEGGEQQ